MIIDLNTTRNLELVVNMKEPRSNHTLFGILNSTQTAMGGKYSQFDSHFGRGPAGFLLLISSTLRISPPFEGQHPAASL